VSVSLILTLLFIYILLINWQALRPFPLFHEGVSIAHVAYCQLVVNNGPESVKQSDLGLFYCIMSPFSCRD
jgi:hypothetical protein